MRIPYPKTDKVPVTIYLTDGIDRNGLPKVVKEISIKCTLSEKNLYMRNSDGVLIKLQSRLYIENDIAPSIENIEGKVKLFNKTYNIYSSARPRDHKGRVHHTKLELI